MLYKATEQLFFSTVVNSYVKFGKVPTLAQITQKVKSISDIYECQIDDDKMIRDVDAYFDQFRKRCA